MVTARWLARLLDDMRHIATPIALFLVCLAAFAQSQQPSPTPPPADRKTVLQRAIDMYEAKKYPPPCWHFKKLRRLAARRRPNTWA